MGIKITLPDTYVEASPVDIKNKKEYDRSGIYVFYDEQGTPLYVGKTVSFKSRFSGHAKKSAFFRLADYVRLYYVSAEYEKDIYETYLINELKPEYNRAKTFYSRLEYEDMLHAVEERITEINQEIQDLDKEITDLYDDDDDYREDCVGEALGELLLTQDRINGLQYELKKLYIRKGTLLGRLSA